MISIVICSADEDRFQRAARMYERLIAGADFEMIRIPDATGMAEGYESAVASSGGELIVFSHDDVEFLALDFTEKLLGHMGHCDILGVVGTRRLIGPFWAAAGPPDLYGQIAYPHPKADGRFNVVFGSTPARRVDRMQALDGVFLCARRPVFQTVLFDKQTFRGFHFYDIDFTFRAYRAGFRVSMACDLFPIHQSTGSFDGTWNFYANAFAEKSGLRSTGKANSESHGAVMIVKSKDDIIGAMTPPHWDD